MGSTSAEITPLNFYDREDLDTNVSEELWYACAGPGVMIPQVGELVVYFPQGHLEQTWGVSKHLNDVPSQVICRVLNLELKSKKDFVYAQLLLQPELIHDFEVINNKGLAPLMPRHPASYFCKKLEVADIVAHAWLSIPRKHAEKCLPQLNMTQMAPMQELVAKDLSGTEWRFNHRLDFATSKNLVAGDAIVILRGQDGELRVGVIRSIRQQRNVYASEITNDRGCERGFNILRSISHAVTTRSKFTILYKPRAGTDQFVVTFSRYVESLKNCYTGMGFRMIFTTEADTEDRVSGTISAIEDFDSAWPGSMWRCLKVNWDKKSHVATWNNVSPWEIELKKRSSACILLDSETIRTRSQRQRAEACLYEAKKVLQLYHDDSMKQESSCIVENKIYLSAVDDLIDLSMGSSFSGVSTAANDVHKQAQAVLDIEMPNLVKTLCGLKLWNTSHFEDLDNSPCSATTAPKLSSQLAFDGPCLSSTSSEPASLSSNSTSASSGDSDLMPAEDYSTLHGIISCLEEKKFDLINPKSVKAITTISCRMIQAGYKPTLRQIITDLSQEVIRDFNVLDFSWNRHCHSHVDEGDSWHGEDTSLQYWNSASQLITRIILEMRRQLNEHNFGAFDELKEDYFAKIIEQPILKLLNVASMSAALDRLLEEVPRDQGLVKCLSSIFLRIGHALSTHRNITDVVPTLLELVSPDCRISVEVIRESVEDFVSRMLDILTNIMSSSVLRETGGSDIHPVSRVVVKGIGLLFQHRETLDLVLARNRSQSLEGIRSSFSCLISNVMMHLESVLDQNSKLMVHIELQCIFLSNNLQFILQEVDNSLKFGYEWVVRYQKKIEHYLNEYIETSWAPVSSLLADKDGKHFSFWRPSCVQQFTTAFQSVYDIQRYWKVPDPHLRERLRASISKKLVPSYCEYLKNHPKDGRSIRITAKELEDLLSELFEG